MNPSASIPIAEPVLTPAQYGATRPDGAAWPLNRDSRLGLPMFSWYQVNRIYPTVQGEGSLAGTPMTIVRLQGCPVGCVWCDTPETWAPNGGAVTYSAKGLTSLVQEFPPRWVLVTGGEPTWYGLDALTVECRLVGLRLALETAGVYPVTGIWDWITLSPKPAGVLPLDPFNLRVANEIKWLVGRARDVGALEVFLEQHAAHLVRIARAHQPEVVVSIQPISCSPRATRLCLDALMQHPTWRLSLQQHKLIGVA